MTRTVLIKNGDVVIRRSAGRLSFVEKKVKASQAVERILSLNAPAGAGLDTLIGMVPSSEFALSARAQQNIRRSFDELVRLQRGSQLGDRVNEERLSSIQRMIVAPVKFSNTTSKTGYYMRVDVLTVAGELAQSSRVLAAPAGG